MNTLLRALRAVVERAFATPVPSTYGRACPSCSRSLDFNCREIAADGLLQYVQCASCSKGSTWRWTDGGWQLAARETSRSRS